MMTTSMATAKESVARIVTSMASMMRIIVYWLMMGIIMGWLVVRIDVHIPWLSIAWRIHAWGRHKSSRRGNIGALRVLVCAWGRQVAGWWLLIAAWGWDI